MPRITIREATPDDAGLVAAFVRELADYERLAHEAEPSEDALRAHLAPSANPRLYALIAEADGVVAGFAVYFFNYSTFATRWGLYLEDIFVTPDYRGNGIAKALFKRLGAVARESECVRLDFNVLKWNRLAIGLYEKLGAETLAEWTPMRFSGKALERLPTF